MKIYTGQSARTRPATAPEQFLPSGMSGLPPQVFA